MPLQRGLVDYHVLVRQTIQSMDSCFAVPLVSLCGCVSISSILRSFCTPYSSPGGATMCRICFHSAHSAKHEVLVFQGPSWCGCVSMSSILRSFGIQYSPRDVVYSIPSFSILHSVGTQSSPGSAYHMEYLLLVRQLAQRMKL